MKRMNVGLTSFKIDQDVVDSPRFQEAKRKRGFLKEFCNSALRRAFVEKVEVNEEKSA
jgi:hypothetical protein